MHAVQRRLPTDKRKFWLWSGNACNLLIVDAVDGVVYNLLHTNSDQKKPTLNQNKRGSIFVG